MNYQDTWYRGSAIAKGYRECASRYELVRAIAGTLPSRFSVLDIGANQNYFGLRLTEEFNGCSVLAFEYSQFEKRAAHVKRADTTGRIRLCKRKISLDDVEYMSGIARFDLILVLSLLHHVGGELDEWLLALKKLGRNVIAEFATDDSRSRVMPNGYAIPADAVHLGSCSSHIAAGVNRPMVLIKGEQ